ncbi:MAG: DegT/DnrJ/EryC1/StrS family aminotransferase [bacterium]|nr:DegT/DnrJ/EryC1/StrS family aminotransferase [bacterium]
MLAIDGGKPVRTEPLPKRALFGEAEKAAAMALFDAAIEHGDVIGYGGPEEAAYEAAFAGFHGGGFADLVNSGTSAVYAALGGLELAPAGEVVIPPITDPGGAMPVALLNLIPVVADAAPGTFNAGAQQIAAVLTPHTRAILVAHIAGEPADMDPILELSRSRGLPVIEDCAQSHGALYHGRPVGTFGAVAAFSTMSGKHHATGPQGGVVFSTDEQIGWRCKRFADRGKPLGLTGGTNVRAGLNLNGNDLSAAVGRVQLARLPHIIAARRRVAAAIADGLAGATAVRLGHEVAETEGVYWFLRIHVDATHLTVDKNAFAAAVAAEGIPTTPSYRHLPAEADWFRRRRVFPPSDYPWGLPDYKGDRQATFPCPQAVEAVESHFLLHIHEKFGDHEVRDIVAALRKVETAYLKENAK